MSRYFQRPGKRSVRRLSVLVGSAAALAGAAPAQAGIVARFDWSTPGNHVFQVPPGVDTAVVDLYGAQGGSFVDPPQTLSGGLGGHVHTLVTLVPGQSWQATVAGAGQSKTYQ